MVGRPPASHPMASLPMEGKNQKRNWEQCLKPKYGNQKNYVGSEHLMIMVYVVGWEHAQATGASSTRRRRRRIFRGRGWKFYDFGVQFYVV